MKTPEKFPEGVCAPSQETSEQTRRASDISICAWPLSDASSSPIVIAQCFRRINATALYMWRSNVLRLRKCSSAAVSHYGVNIRRYSSAKSLPISEREFISALKKVLPWKWNTESKAPLGMRFLLSNSTTTNNDDRLCDQRRRRFHGSCRAVCAG